MLRTQGERSMAERAWCWAGAAGVPHSGWCLLLLGVGGRTSRRSQISGGASRSGAGAEQGWPVREGAVGASSGAAKVGWIISAPTRASQLTQAPSRRYWVVERRGGVRRRPRERRYS